MDLISDHLNQCLYFSDGLVDRSRPYPLLHPPKADGGIEQTPTMASIERGAAGPLFASLIVRVRMKNTELKSTITIYAHLDCIDIRNELSKKLSQERQQVDFAFPFLYRTAIPHRVSLAILDPETEMLPGVGLSAAVVRHFVDVFNNEYGVTLSMADLFAI